MKKKPKKVLKKIISIMDNNLIFLFMPIQKLFRKNLSLKYIK